MIPFKRYINIVSGVGGGAAVRMRDLIARIFTTNELVPPVSYVEFTSADAVLAYFGAGSEEYKRAAFYFGFVSKNITAPQKISFGRWANVATAPKVWGNTTAKALATFTGIAAGSLNLTMGANTDSVTPINLTGAGSLAAVAATIQTAVRLGAGPQYAAATVTFDAVTNRFNLSGGVPGAGAMVVNVSGVGTDLAPLLGWTAGAIVNQGAAIEAITTTLAQSAEASNNFASFAFIPLLNDAQRLEAATWNDTQNNAFMFCARVVDAAGATQAHTDMSGLSGVGVTLSPLAAEYPELLPAMVLAATDYNRRNSVQNYMFQQAALTPSVLTGADADAYDLLRTNYYGRTQSAGATIDFYQRGVLMGLATDAVDMNVYANEIWLKDAAGAALLGLLLALGKVSANNTGRAQIMGVLQPVAQRALTNGTISVGKTLSPAQRLFVAQISGDPLAYLQVQNSGYWLDCTMEAYQTIDNRTEYKAVYTLLYAKDDTVRKVEGSDILV